MNSAYNVISPFPGIGAAVSSNSIITRVSEKERERKRERERERERERDRKREESLRKRISLGLTLTWKTNTGCPHGPGERIFFHRSTVSFKELPRGEGMGSRSDSGLQHASHGAALEICWANRQRALFRIASDRTFESIGKHRPQQSYAARDHKYFTSLCQNQASPANRQIQHYRLSEDPTGVIKGICYEWTLNFDAPAA